MPDEKDKAQEYCIWDWDDLEDGVRISCLNKWVDAEQYFGKPLRERCPHCKRAIRHFE